MAGVANFKNAVSAAWVAATPPSDGSGAIYERIDTLIEERGEGKHRQFAWRRPTQDTPAETTNPNSEWSIAAELYLARNDRTNEAFDNAIEEEVRVLRAAYDGLSAVGVSVFEGVLDETEIDDVDPKRPAKAGGISRSVFCRVTFPFRVLVGG